MYKYNHRQGTLFYNSLTNKIVMNERHQDTFHLFLLSFSEVLRLKFTIYRMSPYE